MFSAQYSHTCKILLMMDNIKDALWKKGTEQVGKLLQTTFFEEMTENDCESKLYLIEIPTEESDKIIIIIVIGSIFDTDILVSLTNSLWFSVSCWSLLFKTIVHFCTIFLSTETRDGTPWTCSKMFHLRLLHATLMVSTYCLFDLPHASFSCDHVDCMLMRSRGPIW